MNTAEKSFNKKLEYIRVLVSFKLLLCKRENCCFRKKAGTVKAQVCEFYHSEEDKRRFPFGCSPEVFEKHQTITRKFKELDSYSLENFFSEVASLSKSNEDYILELRYSNLFMSQNDPDYCLNWTEFAYHPINYKKERCENGENCMTVYCRDYHDLEEKKQFEDLRSIFIKHEDIYIAFQKAIQIDSELIRRNLQTLNQDKDDKFKLSNGTFKDPTLEVDGRNHSLFFNEKSNPPNLEDCKKSEQNNTPPILTLNFSNNSTLHQTRNQPLQPGILNFPDELNKELVFPKGFTSFEGKFFLETPGIIKNEFMPKDFYSNPKMVVNSRPSVDVVNGKKKIGLYGQPSNPELSGKTMSIYRKMESHKFILNQKVIFLENDCFSNVYFLSKLEIGEVSRFICALLNSNGGTIFYGLTKKLIVNGQKINRKDFDFFQVNLDILLRNFQPRVMPDQIKIDLHKVYNNNLDSIPIQDLYVVHFSIYSSGADVYYSTEMNLFYMKRGSEIACLKNHEIVEYVQSKILPDIKKEHLLQKINPQIFERMVPKDLERVIDNFEGLLEYLIKRRNEKRIT